MREQKDSVHIRLEDDQNYGKSALSSVLAMPFKESFSSYDKKQGLCVFSVV